MKIVLLGLVVLNAICADAIALLSQQSSKIGANASGLLVENRSMPKVHHHKKPGAGYSASLLAVSKVASNSSSEAKKVMPRVHHRKEPGRGYVPGSPYYNKQQRLRQDGRSFVPVVSNHPDQPEDVVETVDEHLPTAAEIFWTELVYVVGVLLAGCLYKFVWFASPPNQARLGGDQPSEHPAFCRCGFQYSCLDCSNIASDWKICLCSACCPLVQWAGTASRSVTPFLNFWPALLLMLVLVVLAPFTFYITAFLAALVHIVRRRQLRDVYGHTHPEARSMVEDFCFICCFDSFVCCRLIQEAREVEYTGPNRGVKSVYKDTFAPPLSPRSQAMMSAQTITTTPVPSQNMIYR